MIEHVIEASTSEAMQDLGRRIAGLVHGGDVLLLSGPLGAGKTTFAQGFGAGLGITEPIVSPTFTIARELDGRFADGTPAHLVHVDAYRLQAGDDIESLDLDSALEDSIVVVEWGKGKAEGISPHTLMVEIARPETTLPPGADFADIPEDTPCVLTFRASAGAWDLSGLPAAWEALVRQA